jgi:VWFA-related protein
MFRFRALALVGFLLLSVGLPAALTGQQAADSTQIPEVEREIPYTLSPIGGETGWKITPIVDEDTPRTGTPRAAPTVFVQNPFGAIRVQVRAVREPAIEARVQGRAPSTGDFILTSGAASLSITATPRDRARIDLSLTIPYRYLVQMATTTGDLSYEGFGKAELQTDTGSVSLRVPEELTSFELFSLQEPGRFDGEAEVSSTKDGWMARDQLPEWIDAAGRVTLLPYGRVTLRARQPRAIRLELTQELPEDSRIQPHWRAKELLPDLFRLGRAGGERETPAETQTEASETTFSVDVRLVQLELAATDREGRPAVGLTREDFEVIEKGKAQQLVENISSSDAPFNLVLLLDCSSSTEQDRPAVEEAARRFIGTARPGDRVAVYALAEGYFQVLSSLTEDHEAAKRSVKEIGLLGGGTPLYDAIVLAYAEELAALPRERNAMIILSDGLDNELYYNQPSAAGLGLSIGVPSLVTFEDLQRAVREMRVLIYPVALDPVQSVLRADEQQLAEARRTAAKLGKILARNPAGDAQRTAAAMRWATTIRQRSMSLAAVSGGTVFTADSAEDLDDVYERVARELRSVYTLSYRPLDQQFDGKWRRVRVRANRKGIDVRARPGYYAH